MSYDDAVRTIHDELSSDRSSRDAGFLLEAGRRMQRERRRRGWAAALYVLAAVALPLLLWLVEMKTPDGSDPLFQKLNDAITRTGAALVLCLVAAACLARRGTPRARIFARALAWPVVPACAFGMAAMVARWTWSLDHAPYLEIRALLLATVLGAISGGLLLLRETGPAETEQDGPFAPVAFRGVLTLSMVLTLADATVLVVMAAGMLDVRLLVAAFVLVLIAEGLFRLKVWALFLTWVANPLVVAGMILLAMPLGRSLAASPTDTTIMLGSILTHGTSLLIVTTHVQLVLPIPVVEAMIRGRVVARPRLARVLRALVPIALWGAVGMAVAGAGYLVVRGPTSVLDEPCGGFVARSGCFLRSVWTGREAGGACKQVCLGQGQMQEEVLLEDPSARAPVPSPCPDTVPPEGCRFVVHCYNGASCLCVELCGDDPNSWRGVGMSGWLGRMSSVSVVAR